MNDKISQLIDINDRTSAIEFLKNSEKKSMLQVACRLIYKSIEDDALISTITSCPLTEIKVLRDYLSLEEAMVELGLSEKTLKRHIRRGLTVQEGKIPRYAVNIMKYDFKFWIIMQWEYQTYKQKNQTEEDYINNIKWKIAEFEEDLGGTFEELYGHLTNLEIDFLDEAFDIRVWKDLVEELEGKQKKESD